jgi:hypothetical protein
MVQIVGKRSSGAGGGSAGVGAGAGGGTGSERYLGLLFPTEDYKVYAYITNTRIKFVLVIDDTCTAKDSEIRHVCSLSYFHVNTDTHSLSFSLSSHSFIHSLSTKHTRTHLCGE